MKGTEHYTQAEELLHLAGSPETRPGSERDFLMRAQVHATLALAAATVLLQTGNTYFTGLRTDEWRKAIS